MIRTARSHATTAVTQQYASPAQLHSVQCDNLHELLLKLPAESQDLLHDIWETPKCLLTIDGIDIDVECLHARMMRHLSIAQRGVRALTAVTSIDAALEAVTNFVGEEQLNFNDKVRASTHIIQDFMHNTRPALLLSPQTRHTRKAQSPLLTPVPNRRRRNP